MNKEFKSNLERIYPFQLIWLDWGLLRNILGLSSNNSNKYDFNFARDNLNKTKDILTSQFGCKDPKLLLGYQLLEANKKERSDFMIHLWNEFNYPILIMPDKVGHQYCYIAYTLLEIGDHLLSYLQNTEIDNNIYLKLRQKVLSDGGYDKLNFGNVPELFEQSSKELGESLLNTIEYFRKNYKLKNYNEVYISEKETFSNYFRTILISYPELFLALRELAGISEQKFILYINRFLSSEYFESLKLPIIWANIFSSWMVKDRDRKLTTSERGDLMGLLEIGLFADVGFIDKRTYNSWDKRFDKNFHLKLYQSGRLLTQLFK